MKNILLMDPASVFTSRDAIAAGWSRHQIEWALKSGRWLALRRGVYCSKDRYDAADATERHLLLCRAALMAHDGRHVLSHLSAALTYGLPTPLGDLGRPNLTRGERLASTDRQDDLVVQAARLVGMKPRRGKGFGVPTRLERLLTACGIWPLPTQCRSRTPRSTRV
jgi:Transcriptional regulator, AbiEi antitoxin